MEWLTRYQKIKNHYHNIINNLTHEYTILSAQRNLLFPGIAEMCFILSISVLLIQKIFFPSFLKQPDVLIPLFFLLWSMMALFGLLTPKIYHGFFMGISKDGLPSGIEYALHFDFVTKGGFICNNPIEVYVYMDNFHFKEKYLKKFNIHAHLPITGYKEYKIFFEGSCDLDKRINVGVADIDLKSGRGKVKLFYTLPGKYPMRHIFERPDGKPCTMSSAAMGTLNTSITVSPSETLHQIRVGNIIYGLTLITLCVAIMGLFYIDILK